ncbi:uncharacterized protein LOC142823814 isoform X2 [Pelodiscus sinensis]|uniref:uncharacterized protein LOC142823814 isoform X2 n=1 Tax=Pelodiscus sinensis TaxID=13735 RepID=UPI003F6BF3A5
MGIPSLTPSPTCLAGSVPTDLPWALPRADGSIRGGGGGAVPETTRPRLLAFQKTPGDTRTWPSSPAAAAAILDSAGSGVADVDMARSQPGAAPEASLPPATRALHPLLWVSLLMCLSAGGSPLCGMETIRLLQNITKLLGDTTDGMLYTPEDITVHGEGAGWPGAKPSLLPLPHCAAAPAGVHGGELELLPHRAAGDPVGAQGAHQESLLADQEPEPDGAAQTEGQDLQDGPAMSSLRGPPGAACASILEQAPGAAAEGVLASGEQCAFLFILTWVPGCWNLGDLSSIPASLQWNAPGAGQPHS